MPACFTFEECSQCPSHECHRIATPDSFEHEFGIYCSEVKVKPDGLNQRTLDGPIDSKLIACSDNGSEMDAKVPDWCPHYVDK